MLLCTSPSWGPTLVPEERAGEPSFALPWQLAEARPSRAARTSRVLAQTGRTLALKTKPIALGIYTLPARRDEQTRRAPRLQSFFTSAQLLARNSRNAVTLVGTWRAEG